MQTQGKKPRKVHIDVTENGKKTADVRLPYGMFKMGMKFGSSAAKAEKDSCAQAMAKLVDFDCAAFERSIAQGEIILPYQLLDATDGETNTHVVITAE